MIKRLSHYIKNLHPPPPIGTLRDLDGASAERLCWQALPIISPAAHRLFHLQPIVYFTAAHRRACLAVG